MPLLILEVVPMFENLVSFVSRAYESLDRYPVEIRRLTVTRCAGACDFACACNPELIEQIEEFWDNTWLPLFRAKLEG